MAAPAASASAASSSVPVVPATPFDAHVQKLVKIGKAVHDSFYGSGNEPKLWMNWLCRFQSVYAKAGKPAAFHQMFMSFYLANMESIAQPIFFAKGDDSGVNDKWLLEGVEGSKSPRTKGNSSWNPVTMNQCRGKVIYYDESKKSVSVPISEMYRTAVDLYRKDSGNVKAETYPAALLYHLYALLDDLLPPLDGGKKVITENTKKLNEIVNRSGIDKVETAAAGTNLGDMISGVMKSAGVNGPATDSGTINSTINSVLGNSAGDGISKVLGELFKAAKPEDGQPGGIGQMLSGIGRALQSQALQETIGGVAAQAQSQMSSLAASIPTASAPGSASVAALPAPTADPSAQD